MNYMEVNQHIEQVIKGSAFLAKIKGPDPIILDTFEAQYSNNINDLDNAITMCFYQWFLSTEPAYFQDTNSVFMLTFNVINKIENILEAIPECWILWILKYKIISFMNFNQAELIENLIQLREAQHKQVVQGYYLVTDLLLAHVYYSSENYNKAIHTLENLLQDYNKKVTILVDFFKSFLIEFKNLVIRSNETNVLILLEQINKKYF